MENLIQVLQHIVHASGNVARSQRMRLQELENSAEVNSANNLIQDNFDVFISSSNNNAKVIKSANDPINPHDLYPIHCLNTAKGWLNFFECTRPHHKECLEDAIERLLWNQEVVHQDAEAPLRYLATRLGCATMRTIAAQRDDRLMVLSLEGDCWAARTLFEEPKPQQSQDPEPQDPEPQDQPQRAAFYHTDFIEGVYGSCLDDASNRYQEFACHIRAFESNPRIGHSNTFDIHRYVIPPESQSEIIETLIGLRGAEGVQEWILNAVIRYVRGDECVIRIQEISEFFDDNVDADFPGVVRAFNVINNVINDVVDDVVDMGLSGAMIHFIDQRAAQATTARYLAYAFVFFRFAIEYRKSNRISQIQEPTLLAAVNRHQLQYVQLQRAFDPVAASLFEDHASNGRSRRAFDHWVGLAPFRTKHFFRVIEREYC